MAPSTRPAPVQKFRPTNGTVPGYLGIGAAALLSAYVLVTDPSWESVRVSLVAALVALVVWVALLRPRAGVYGHTLTLQNMLRDTHLPLAEVDDVVVRHTLNVWVRGRRYVGVGIGRSTRALLGTRSRGPMSYLGLEQVDDRMGAAHIGEIGTSGDYHRFVETRIIDLARSARRDGVPTHDVRVTWALPELASLAVLGAVAVLALLVG